MTSLTRKLVQLSDIPKRNIPFQVALETLPDITSEGDLVQFLLDSAEQGFLSFDLESKTFRMVVSIDVHGGTSQPITI